MAGRGHIYTQFDCGVVVLLQKNARACSGTFSLRHLTRTTSGSSGPRDFAAASAKLVPSPKIMRLRHLQKVRDLLSNLREERHTHTRARATSDLLHSLDSFGTHCKMQIDASCCIAQQCSFGTAMQKPARSQFWSRE